MIGQWRADKVALAAVAGKVAVLHAGALRVDQVRGTVAQTQATFVELARQVDTLTGELPRSGGAVQAVDYKLAPPPDPAYPVNDVIGEVTDLDRSHRRPGVGRSSRGVDGESWCGGRRSRARVKRLWCQWLAGGQGVAAVPDGRRRKR